MPGTGAAGGVKPLDTVDGVWVSKSTSGNSTSSTRWRRRGSSTVADHLEQPDRRAGRRPHLPDQLSRYRRREDSHGRRETRRHLRRTDRGARRLRPVRPRPVRRQAPGGTDDGRRGRFGWWRFFPDGTQRAPGDRQHPHLRVHRRLGERARHDHRHGHAASSTTARPLSSTTWAGGQSRTWCSSSIRT